MIHKRKPAAVPGPGTLTRREFAVSAASAAGLSLVGPSALAASSRKVSLERMHIEIPKLVTNLTQNRPESLTLMYPKGCIGNIMPVADRFTAATGVRVEYRETPVDDVNTRILLDTTKNISSFDIALPATFGVPDLAEAGALADLGGFAETYEPAGFQEGLLYSIGDSYRGRLYGYQTDGDAYVMFYNEPWFDEPDAAKAYEDKYDAPLTTPRTWVELDCMMEFFHRPDENRFGGCLFRTPNYMVWEWWVRFHAKGFYPVSDDMEPQINNEAGVEALEELIKASSHQHPKASTNGLFDNWKTFAEGSSFCNIGWGGTQKYLNSDRSGVRGRLKFAPTPGGMVDGRPLKVPYFNWGWNYVVSERSAKKELAYLFILFASSPEMSTLAVSNADGFFDPFRSEHYDHPAIKETYGEPFLAAHKASMQESIPDFYLKGQGAYFDVLKENIFIANSGDLTAKQALDITAEEWNHITWSMGQATQIEQWRFLKSRYPEHLRGFLS